MRTIKYHTSMANWKKNTKLYSFLWCYGFLQILAGSCNVTFSNKALLLKSTFHNLSSRSFKIHLVISSGEVGSVLVLVREGIQ